MLRISYSTAMNTSYTLLASWPAVRTLYSHPQRMSFDWLTALQWNNWQRLLSVARKTCRNFAVLINICEVTGKKNRKYAGIVWQQRERQREKFYGGPIGTHQHSFERYHPSSSPRLGFATPPKTPIAIISGTGKATNFKFCTHIHGIDRNESPLKISEKVAVAVLGDSRNYTGRIAQSSLR